MPNFYLNKDASKNPNNDHEIHVAGCEWMPSPENIIDLGFFPDCHGALKKAKEKYWSNSDGCKDCCNSCHHG